LKFRGSSNQKIYDVKQSIMLDKPILSDLNWLDKINIISKKCRGDNYEFKNCWS
jgi:hypothetical protein